MTHYTTAVVALLCAASPLAAQSMSAGQSMPAGHDMAAMAGHDMPGMDHEMPGMMGPHPMTREASGTSWGPDSSPHEGAHFDAGDWSLMAHGNVAGIYSSQGGPRGDNKAFSTSHLMLMASRPLGERGTLAFRGLFSLDALIGKRGYPLLFATGETADGRTQLVDRQHPHDLIAELAASYAYDLGGGYAVSLYGGPIGEPALGPPVYLHRASGQDIPETPISHHWFDSTHLAFGVLTGGIEGRSWKLEASAFKGREPDQYRYDIETPALDSWAVRLFWNPTPNLSLQASTGFLHSPEQLKPDENERRTTISASFNLPLSSGGNWATTIGASAKHPLPGPTIYAFLAESTLRIDPKNTVFARAEHAEEAELFPETDRRSGIYPTSKLSVGYFRTLPRGRLDLDVGGLASAYAYPTRLEATYGSAGVKSFLLFVRVRLAR